MIFQKNHRVLRVKIGALESLERVTGRISEN